MQENISLAKTKKIILVTGANSHLGVKLVRSLALKGHIVYAGVRDQKKLTVKENLVRPIIFDVTSDQACKIVVEKIIREERGIDVLVNNAAYTLSGPTLEFASREYMDILNTNTIGAFRLIKEVYPYMKNEKSGKIINITSLNGLISFPNFGLYSSSKFAIEALGLSLRYELAKDGIYVTNIAPGAILPDKQNSDKSISHKTAREKFWLLRMLMPMISVDIIAERVAEIIENPFPPARVILGRDAKLTTTLQRLLPFTIWDRMMSLVWNKK